MSSKIFKFKIIKKDGTLFGVQTNTSIDGSKPHTDTLKAPFKDHPDLQDGFDVEIIDE